MHTLFNYKTVPNIRLKLIQNGACHATIENNTVTSYYEEFNAKEGTHVSFHVARLSPDQYDLLLSIHCDYYELEKQMTWINMDTGKEEVWWCEPLSFKELSLCHSIERDTNNPVDWEFTLES